MRWACCSCSSLSWNVCSCWERRWESSAMRASRSAVASASARSRSACATRSADSCCAASSLSDAVSWAICASFCTAAAPACSFSRETASSTACSLAWASIRSRRATSFANSASRTWFRIWAYPDSSTWNTVPHWGHLISLMDDSFQKRDLRRAGSTDRSCPFDAMLACPCVRAPPARRKP